MAIGEDPELLRRVADERVPLTVCPTSNVVIANRFTSLAEHPLLAMRGAGLLVTINTDDPAMMGIDLSQEYRAVAEAHAMSVESLGELAVEGIESTWRDESDRSTIQAEFEAGTTRLSEA